MTHTFCLARLLLLSAGCCTAFTLVEAQTSGSRSGAPDFVAAAESISSVAPAYPVRSISSPELAAAALPEAPAPQITTQPEPKKGTNPKAHIADKATRIIPSDWHAQPLSSRDKVRIGAETLYSFGNFGGIFLAAGYEHVTNGEPNYGSDKGAFGERLGAAAIRDSSQLVFTDMVFAPVLHEDPRYYVKGPRFNAVRRTLYAITRPVITRKDDGSSTINGSLLLGYAVATAITPAYYPQSNRNARDVISVYGGSVGGAALGCFISEFSQDVLRVIRPNRAP